MKTSQHLFGMMRIGLFVGLGLVFIFCNDSKGQSAPEPDSSKTAIVKYGKKGFELQTRDNKFLLQIQSRLQFRFATPNDQDPVTFDDFEKDNMKLFRINRARLKIGGHAFQPWLKYNWEYELSQSNLLDFRVMIEKWEWLSFKAGQWKVEFSRERFISSGEQQMMDRSVINRPFTIDRQQGVEVYGRLKGSGLLDFNYWAATLTGTGRGGRDNDDNHLMYFGRWQWNFLGSELGFEGSDLKIHEEPASIIAVSAVTNRSPYTRFSQAGGGSLQGFENGQAGQYRVRQLNIETAFMYHGFSWQSELHQKEIIDKLNIENTTVLRGYYVQGGYFVHQSLSWWPQPLELAVRHAAYYPNTKIKEQQGTETSMAMNWFFSGHKNKLTTEVNYFNYENIENYPAEEWRLRLQWEISF
ncbi:MAG TPA: porin [Cyclobacteriaceae bacterium]